jgi:5-methylthioadenosine/S-adenosylhomocysteine deaminase
MRAIRLLLTLVVFAFVSGAIAAATGQGAAGLTPPRALIPASLIVTGGTVVTQDGSRRIIENGAVAVSRDKIVAVDTASSIASRYSSANVINARGQLIMPGLINTHGHAAMVLFRGLGSDLALQDWLNKYIFPAEGKLVSPEFVRVGTRLAALEMIASGTTTFTDMYYFEDDVAKAVKESGMRAVLGQSLIDFPVADAKTHEESMARIEGFLQAWAGDPLITPAAAPHAPYTVSDDHLKAVRALANKYNAPMLIHLAETEQEVIDSNKTFGMSPTKRLEGLGVWTGKTVAAHSVWLNDEDMAILGRRGVGLSHNPESNMKLASGVAPVQKWIDHGIRAGLGTDGAASNNDLDMFEAIRQASFMHKLISKDPRAMPASLAVDLATRGGADALGMGDRIGSLEVGKQADIITISLSSARQTPMFEPLGQIAFVTRGDDVRNTIVAGKVLMRDRVVRTLNSAAVIRDARAMAAKVKDAVK